MAADEVALGDVDVTRTHDGPCTVEAVRAVYREYFVRLAEYAGRLTGDAADAEDVVHEAFEDLLVRRLFVTKPVPYLYRAVTHRAIDRGRRRTRDRRLLDRIGDAPPVPAPDTTVMDAVRRLPTDQRTAVVLFYFADLPIADVAAVMKRPFGTVGRLLTTARRTLERDLGGPDA